MQDLRARFVVGMPDLHRAASVAAVNEFEIVDAVAVGGTVVVVVVVVVVEAVDEIAAWAVVGVAGAADSRVFGRCFVVAPFLMKLEAVADFRSVFQL